ncbi:hypothetical protein AZI85_13295 [Bdellovibrio bacteriovorus]|uniref:VWFA domain-containing protein n=1 Tax=Bdellovibrio bacteriovorus TaxID=959 RepID=A0A150WBU2_BDEBC|nr:hypothetical protein [Bdellovibrio bacteriovorus]KYG60437.1 hypothetical protein AZI85_13295 [Bdellovibrio bacteriovorus]
MRNLVIVAIYFTAFMLVSACSPESATLRVERPLVEEQVQIPQYDQIPAQTFEWITEDGGQSQFDFNPEVDILFVTDNSDSMKTAQDNLLRNIDRFTAGILKNKMIDYHIGVISVWDSSDRYAQTKKDIYQIGDLRYIKNTQGQTSQSRRFVAKSDNNSKLIASTLNIGVTPYAQGGPEFEELFSPLAAALEKTGRGAANEGFFRKEAQLVVVLLTDADDSSKNLNPEEMAQKLIDFKGGRTEKVAVYGVLVRPQDPDTYKDWDLRIHPKYHPECFDMNQKTPKNNGKCTGFGPARLEQLIVAANPNEGTPEQIRAKHIMSIVSPKFGDELAQIGSDITVKTLSKEIFLSQRPRADKNGQLMVRVRYGKQVIPQKAKGGWLYNPEDNSIVLSGDIDYQYVEGARFSVDLVPLTLKN